MLSPIFILVRMVILFPYKSMTYGMYGSQRRVSLHFGKGVIFKELIFNEYFKENNTINFR